MMRRRLLFGSAAVAALWSAWIVTQNGSDATAMATSPARGALPAPPMPEVAAQPASQAASGTAPTPTRLSQAATDDVFATRQWLPPPPPPPPAPPPPPPPPVAPPPPPTLPYRFVGLLDEGSAAKPRVFLSLGDKLLVAGVGDTLEGGYQLVAITTQELVFNHVQNNVTLKLVVTGGRS